MSALELIAAAFGGAFLLALGFHRHRAAQVCGLLCLLTLGLDAPTLQLREAALRLTPWLILGCALMPEPRLLSRRHGVLLVLVGGLVLLALHGPPRLLAMPVTVAGWPLFGLDPGRGAATVLLLAGLACITRFVLRAQLLEVGLALCLLLAAIGMARIGEAAGWLAATAALAVAAILYASYRMAFIDTLSGLPNRRALDEALSRLSGEYSLAMVDIDHFKAFNDQHGHDAGDVVLREVAARLRRSAGGEAYRYGGEEFTVIYRGLDAAQGAKRLEQARLAVEGKPMLLPPPKPIRSRNARRIPRPAQVSVTVSGGLASRSPQRRLASEVLKAADQALYKAKERGRNRVERS